MRERERVRETARERKGGERDRGRKREGEKRARGGERVKATKRSSSHPHSCLERRDASKPFSQIL